jgi:hypothetical protein
VLTLFAWPAARLEPCDLPVGVAGSSAGAQTIEQRLATQDAFEMAGLAATALVQSSLGVVGGDWAANWAALSLTVLAIASVVAGLESLLGRAGIFVGAATMIVIGNALSAVSSAPELLPQPAGAIGRLLPPGAGGNLLRSTGFFDGAAAGGHVAVLVAWVLGGLTALLAAAARDRRRTRVGGPAGAKGTEHAPAYATR